MTRKRIFNLSEMSDSHEVLAERPNKFVLLFAYFIIVLLVIALVWAFLGEIDVYIRATGEVRPNDKISTVRSILSGKIKETYIEDGMTVQKGDTLFVIDVQYNLKTLEILERQYNTISCEIENLIRLRECVILSENQFDPSDASQIDYYYRYRKYVTDIDTAVESIENINLDIERFHEDALATRENASDNRNRVMVELSALQLLLNSIESGENLVPDRNGEHHRRYLDFEINIGRYEDLISSKSASLWRMEQLYAVGGVSLTALETAQLELDSILYERDRYVNEIQISVLQGITTLELSVSDIGATIRSADSILALSGGGFSEELLRERYMLDTLTSISEALFSLQNNRDTLHIDIVGLRLILEEAQVLAPISGVVSMFGEMNAGDFIQTGMDIATILPTSKSEHRVMLFVSNADIADIEVGQKTNFRFAALPFMEYGEMPGIITRISSDTYSNDEGQSYYIVEATMDEGSLYDRNGVEAKIVVGMVCDVRVITSTKKIIHWVLEKLDFID